jgi:hypothetical protein
MWEVKSIPRILKSSYGEKLLLNIFIYILGEEGPGTASPFSLLNGTWLTKEDGRIKKHSFLPTKYLFNRKKTV